MVGGAIGKELRPPWLAMTTAFTSHFVLDVIPHLDSHGLFGVSGAGPTPLEIASAAVDTVLGIALLLWVTSRQPNRRLMLWGGFFGALLDLLDHLPPWKVWFRMLPITSQLSQFHAWVSHGVGPSEWPIGVSSQALVTAIALFILLRHRKPAPGLHSE
jgi:hypothetical protein